MRVYIAGPMRGIKRYNVEAFTMAEIELEQAGHDPVNPHREDMKNGFDLWSLPDDHDWSMFPKCMEKGAVWKRCREAVDSCHAVYLLEGWEESEGAVKEVNWAREQGKIVIYPTDPMPENPRGERYGGVNKTIRTFDTGATRNLDDNKLDYFGFICPEALHRYAEYMHNKRVQADGTLRDSDNWKKGIPRDQYIRSLLRHVWDLWRLHLGFTPVDPDSGDESEAETLLCAIMFNAHGYLHECLKND